ncbi:MAG: putative 7-carboxy-7-deazaguanine synthase QueE [Eubacterium sp.]|nr:putative 7-carboxy-7-deazaguanine synthase QueE [Eubacterium sp.]
MKVVEKFVSINGESTRAGELAVFLRFKGCNLNCSYCDTKWANEVECPYESLSVEEIVQYVKETGIKNVTLTGGEPMLQNEIVSLVDSLLEQPGIRVEIETNGSVDLSQFSFRKKPVFTMDYKSPSSGCNDRMCLENFRGLTGEDTVKCVVANREDLDRAKSVIEQYQLTEKCHVYFSPVFGSIEPEEIVNYMLEHKMNDVRLQIQMHKVIWDPNQRGV